MDDLVLYNCFGLMRVGRGSITVSATAVKSSGTSITKTLTEELETVIGDIEEGELGVVVFGVMIQPGHKYRIALHEMSSLKSGVKIGDLPQVEKVFSKVLKLVSKE